MLRPFYKNRFDVDEARIHLKQFDDYTSELGIEYCLVGGTLLGYVRHGKLMSWDDDIDLLMRDEDILKLWDLISLKYSHAKICRDLPTVEGGYFDWFGRFTKNGTAIDVWPWKFSEDESSVKTFVGKFLASKTFPYQKVDFEGSSYSIPRDPIHYLNRTYRDWKTKIVKRVDGHDGKLLSKENFSGQLHYQTCISHVL